MHRFAVVAAAAAIACFAGLAASDGYLPGESVTFDAASGEYVFTFTLLEVDESGSPRAVSATSRYEPRTRIEPLIQSAFKPAGDRIEYRYRLKNGIAAARAVIGFNMDGLSDLIASTPVITNRAAANEARKAGTLDTLMRNCKRAIVSPPGWRAMCAVQSSLRVGWLAPTMELDGAEGLQPGFVAMPFGINSRDLPGVSVGQFRGYSRGWGETRDPIPGDFDRHEISDALERNITRIAHEDSVERFVAVPMFANTLDVPALLAALRQHVLSWDATLMDTDVAAQVSSSLAAAASAYQRGERQATNKALHDARQVLARKYGDLEGVHPEDDPTNSDASQDPSSARQLAKHDRRLAARVLTFDIKALEARIK